MAQFNPESDELSRLLHYGQHHNVPQLVISKVWVNLLCLCTIILHRGSVTHTHCEWHVTGPLDPREAMEALTRVIEAEKRLKFEGDFKEFIYRLTLYHRKRA